MKKHLIFHYSYTVLVFLLATFPTRRRAPVSSAHFPNDHFTAAVAPAKGVSEGSIRAHKVQRQSASATPSNGSGLPLD